VLPISDALLRELMAEVLGDRSIAPGVRLIAATVLPDEVVRLEVAIGGSVLSKRVSPELHLSGVHGLPGAPSIRVTMPRQYSWLATRVLRRQPLGFVHTEGEVLTIDLGALARRRGNAEIAALLPLLKRADLRSELGTLFVDFEVTLP